MPCVRKKTPGIRQHSDKIAKKPQICKRCHLVNYSLFIVVEPPCASLLDLSGASFILKTTDDSANYRIIRRIQAVQDCPGKGVSLIQCVQ